MHRNVDGPRRVRRQGLARLSALSVGIGVTGVVGAAGIALALPGATPTAATTSSRLQGGTSATSSGAMTNTTKTSTTATAAPTTSATPAPIQSTSAPASTFHAAVATSGGS